MRCPAILALLGVLLGQIPAAAQDGLGTKERDGRLSFAEFETIPLKPSG